MTACGVSMMKSGRDLWMDPGDEERKDAYIVTNHKSPEYMKEIHIDNMSVGEGRSSQMFGSESS